MKIKEGTGWKACHNEEKGVYGAEIVFQGSWDLYEISGAVFSSLVKNIGGGEAEELIRTGRHLYAHVNDRCGPPYDVVLDEDYAEYCPWAGTPKGNVWSGIMTDAAVELLESEKENREQRRKKRGQGKKQ